VVAAEPIAAPGGRATRVDLTLSNGLRVILEENHVSPVVAMQAWVGAGAADDPPELAGIAHLFEHTLFKSTKRRGAGRIAHEIDAVGGSIDAWTTPDETAYQLVLAPQYLDAGVDVLADALTNATFDPIELERERKTVLSELREGEASPERAAAQLLFHAAFKVHPYGRSVLGTEPTVAALTRDQLLAAYQRIYVGKNLTLVMVGDFEGAALAAKIKQAFSALRKGEAMSARPTEPAQTAPRTVVVARDLLETRLVLSFRTPAVSDADVPALDLLATILGQGERSRLNLQLLRSRQLVTAASAYMFAARDAGLLVVSASTPPGRLEEPARALLDEVLRLGREEVSPAELDRARALLATGVIRDQETPAGHARRLGFFARTGGGSAGDDDPGEARYLARIAAATPAEVRAVAARYLRTAGLSSGALVSARGLTAARGAVDPVKLAARLEGVWAAGEARADRRFAAVPIVTAGDVARAVLPSGVRILVLRDASPGLVAVHAIWPGGTRYEDERSNGISNLLAILLPRGTRSRAGGELAAALEGMSGSLSGFSTRNSLGLRADFAVDQWERGLELVADCIANPRFAEDDLERERRVVLDRIRARDRNPVGLAFQLFSSALWTRHPYRLPELGTVDAVASLTRRRLVDHYRRYYGASGLTIAVVGDVTPSRVVGKIQALLGDLSGVAADPAAVAGEPPRSEPQEVFRDSPADEAHVVLGYPGTTLRDPDGVTLEVLAELLSGPNGRLAPALREARALTLGPTASSFEGIDPGSFAVYFACRPEGLEASVGAVRAELARVVERGVTQEEVVRARQRLVGTHAIRLDRRSAVAAALAFHEAQGLGWREFRRDADALARVTIADVQRVARKFLDPRREVVAVVRPNDEPPAQAKRGKADLKPSASSSPSSSSSPAATLKSPGAGRSSAP
jgi:zinc protease